MQWEVIALREKLERSLPAGLLTLLYALGLTLTLMQVLGIISQWGVALAVLLALSAAVAAGGIDRRIAWAAGGFGALVMVLWLVTGGVTAVREVLMALSLHINGLPTALPLVAGDAALMAAALCGVMACFVTQRSAGPYPALVLLLLTAVVLWLTDMMDVLWCLLPSVIASVALMLLGEHDMNPMRVLPLAVATVLLSYTAVAVGGAVIPALQETAHNVRQHIYDIFFFTGSREEFSLADVGFYPQGEGQLGGPADPSEEEIMAVITPRRVYLRGVIRNDYTGRAWNDTTEGKRYLWDSPRFRSTRDDAFDGHLPAVTGPEWGQLLSERKIIVHMLGGSASTLFMPQRVRQLSARSEMVVYFNAGSEIFTTRNLVAGDGWEADAPVFEAGEAGLASLISACAKAEDPHWEAVNSVYRALPPHYYSTTSEEFGRLQNIVYEVTAGAQTPYEAALMLQQHLRSSYAYTLEAPEQSPDHDFVCSFILYDKAGYCTHFASAMTIMARMAGLPARYVEGFVATPETEGERAGMAVVTGEQGHAWTEIYFRGVGWVTFDATPAGADVVYVTPDQLMQSDGSSEDPQQTPEATPVPEPTATPAPTATPEPATPTPAPSTPTPEATGTPDVPQDESMPAPEAPPTPFPWGGLLAGLLLLALVGRVIWMTPTVLCSRQKNEFHRWLVWAQAAHDALRQMGLERQSDETPMAFFARVDETNRIPQVLSQLSGAESLMFYGHAAPMPEETAQARQSFRVICAQLNPWQKLRMTLQRAFLLRRSRDITLK